MTGLSGIKPARGAGRLMVVNHLDTILVTGCPRSGTTAVGDVLASVPGGQYLYEPMNATTGDRAIKTFFEFSDGSPDENASFDRFVKRVQSLDLNLRPGVSHRDVTMMKIVKAFVGGRSRISLMRCRLSPGLRTLVWKDPFASFAAVDIADRHGIPVLVTFRTIHEVAASFKRLGWGFDLPALYDRLEAAGRRPIVPRRLLTQADGAENGAGLWALVYGELARASERLPTLIRFVNVDELIRNPARSYQNIFDWWGRSLQTSTRLKIEKVYGSAGAAKKSIPSARAHDRNRDLSKVSTYWRSILTEREAERVNEISASVGDLNVKLGIEIATSRPGVVQPVSP